MSKAVSAFELTLNRPPADQTLANWLYSELRSAILENRLPPGSRLPASRDFARLHRVSRGTVVSVFERLQAEGYVSSGVGVGTWVNRAIAASQPPKKESSAPPAYARRVIGAYARPRAFQGLVFTPRPRPFRMGDPALNEFPATIWGRLAARRARRFDSWLKTEDDGSGFRPLREAIAQYLGSSRGIRCNASQVVIVSGVQQGLDLLARLLLKPGEPVWMEDPGYFGATIAFQNAGARIVPVPVDDEGLSVAAGMRQCAGPKGIYLTPAHQFPLGMMMSLERRMEVLKAAAQAGAFIIEDDYDSEYRFEGRPVPALQSLDRGSNAILVGSFNKLLFPSLRMGYVVLPACLADFFIAFRHQTGFRSSSLDQAVLCDFIMDGHLGRHLRRMRDLYAARLEALMNGGRRYLDGLLRISGVRAGLCTVGYLRNGMTSRQAEAAALAHGLEAMGLDRYTMNRPDPRGLLLGFSAFDEGTLTKALIRLSAALGEGRKVNSK